MYCVQTNSLSGEDTVAFIYSHEPVYQAAKRQKLERFGHMSYKHIFCREWSNGSEGTSWYCLVCKS